MTQPVSCEDCELVLSSSRDGNLSLGVMPAVYTDEVAASSVLPFPSTLRSGYGQSGRVRPRSGQSALARIASGQCLCYPLKTDSNTFPGWGCPSSAVTYTRRKKGVQKITAGA